MIDDFLKVLELLENSEQFKQFKEKHKEYYLAHGFIQLDENLNEKSCWQIGYYSKENDNLAIFDLKPINLLPFEKAFKKEGIISKLETKNIVPTNEVLKKIAKHLQLNYKQYIPNSYLLIIQVINDVPVFNITAITTSFHMINIRLNAITLEIILNEIKSILDLRHGN